MLGGYAINVMELSIGKIDSGHGLSASTGLKSLKKCNKWKRALTKGRVFIFGGVILEV
jgi:hypothetical protein